MFFRCRRCRSGALAQSKVEVTLEIFTCRLLVSRFFTLLLVLAEAALRSRDRSRGTSVRCAGASSGPCLLSRGPTENKKDEAPCMVRVCLNLCVVCPRPPGHPTGAAPKILQKISRAPWAEGTFERNRDTRDFAHFSHLQRDLKPVAPDFSCFFFVFIADFSDQTSKKRSGA